MRLSMRRHLGSCNSCSTSRRIPVTHCSAVPASSAWLPSSSHAVLHGRPLAHLLPVCSSSSSSSSSFFQKPPPGVPCRPKPSGVACRAANTGGGTPSSSSGAGTSTSGSSSGGGGGSYPPPEDPWATPSGNGSSRSGSPVAGGPSNGSAASTPDAGGNGNGNGANRSGFAPPRYEATDWGWDAGVAEDWDPSDGLNDRQLADMAADYAADVRRARAQEDPPRDKWITPLLDWKQIAGAFDPDQSRTEEGMADEALTNKAESRAALSFAGRLVAVPLVVGALLGRAVAQPVLGFVLQNNPDAFAMTEHQKIEGAQAVHMEETRVRMLVAIGQAPPLTDDGMLQHLREYALEYQVEEREKNERNLMTLVSDTISAMVLFIMVVRDSDGRASLFNTLGRLFEGLSDIAKAVMIILVADTLLGYHSEEGWTGLLDLLLGHYGVEVEEEDIVLFVGIIPIAIDVAFKYWIFVGLNKISPGAVVTIKQIDRH